MYYTTTTTTIIIIYSTGEFFINFCIVIYFFHIHLRISYLYTKFTFSPFCHCYLFIFASQTQQFNLLSQCDSSSLISASPYDSTNIGKYYCWWYLLKQASGFCMHSEAVNEVFNKCELLLYWNKSTKFFIT